MDIKKAFFISSSALLISACGGGGGGDDEATTSVSADSAAGIYSGTINYTADSDVGQTSDSLVGFIAPNGEVAFLSENQGSLNIGEINIADDGSFTGSGTEYDGAGNPYGSGDVSGDYSSTTQQLSGSSFDNSDTKLSDYTLNYDAQTSEAGASFDAVAGTYAGGINIQANGNIDIDDGGTCQGAGGINIPDSNLNLYRFTVDITNSGCDVPQGSYNGYLSVVDGSLIYLVYNNSFAAYYEL